MGEIRVVMDPEQRQKYIDMLLELDGLSHIKEDSKASYCPLSLTLTPDELKGVLKSRQEILMKEVLEVSGITAYDPGSAPYSPDKNLTSLPSEIYTIDSGKIVGARYFVGHHIIASSGFGDEAEKAKVFNRMAVVLMDKKIRVSRMQPHRAIYLEYGNFQKEASQFIPIFQILQEYEPGMGFNGQLPVLLGFEKNSGRIVDLEEKVYTEFPNLQYKYNGKVPIIKLRVENPELFYEVKTGYFTKLIKNIYLNFKKSLNTTKFMTR